MSIPAIARMSYLSLALLGATPQVLILVSPLVLGWAVAQFGLSETHAGLLVASEFAGLTVIAFLTPWITRKADRRLLAAAGVMIGVAMQGLTVVANTPLLLYPLRFTGGLGLGLAGSIAIMCLSAVPRPGHAVAVLSFFVVMEGLLLFLCESALRIYTPDALFGLIAISALLGLPFLRYLPACAPVDNGRFRPFSRGGLLLVAYGFWIMSNATVWSFVERMGTDIGLAPATINQSLGIATLVVFAGIAIYFVAGRWLTVVLLGAHAALGCAYLVTIHAEEVFGFAMGLSLCTAASAAGNIMFLDLMARFDRSGRIGAMSAGIGAVATAIGPVVGSFALAGGGYEGVALAGMAQLVLGTLLLIAGGFVLATRARSTEAAAAAE